MTRRMLDSSMWTNEHFGEMPMMARLLLLGIINHADDQGRIKAHLVFLRSQIFPYDDVTTEQIDECLTLIEANGTIELYEAGGKRYIQLRNWWEYQTLNFAIPSDYPAPEGWRDRLRFNGKGGIMYTHNWHKVDGSSTPDNCDHLGIPLPTQPGKVKPPTDKVPPTNNGASHVPAQVSTHVPSHVDTLVARQDQDKDYKKDHDQEEDQAASRARVSDPEPTAPAAPSPQDDALDPKALIADLRQRQFMYLDKDAITIAAQLIADYSWDRIMEVADNVEAKHKAKITNGDHGIIAPLAYMRSVLAGGIQSPRGVSPPIRQSMGEDSVDKFLARVNGRSH